MYKGLKPHVYCVRALAHTHTQTNMCLCLTQKKTVLKIRSHYQKKLNLIKTILDIYQEKVEKRNIDLEKRVTVSIC